jgi:hypothetical protein
LGLIPEISRSQKMDSKRNMIFIQKEFRSIGERRIFILRW